MRRRRPPRVLALPQVLPNLLTVGAICAGLTSIRFAQQGRYGEAVALILLAALLDGLDGRLARLLKAESPIGAELDSLADFVNFGVAPGFVLYAWVLHAAPGAGWGMVLIYAICCVLRLARFNVAARSAAPAGGRGGFVGVPAPGGALLALMPLYLGRLLGDGAALPPLAVGAWLGIVGLLMISRLPTPSLKSAVVRAEHVRFLLVAGVAVIAALFTWPWATLLAVSLAYLVVIARAAWRERRSFGARHGA